MSEPDRTRLPVTVLTGFSGGGKAALLRCVIARSGLAQCAVLITCTLKVRFIGFACWRHVVRDHEADHIFQTIACMLGEQALAAEWPAESTVLSMESSI